MGGESKYSSHHPGEARGGGARVLRHRRARGERRLAAIRQLLQGIEIGQVADVLELVCGAGEVAAGLAATHPFRVVGVDADPARIGAARARIGAVERLRFEVAEPRHLPFADASFDLVITQASYERLAEWQRALEEIARVLRPAGHLFWLDLDVPAEQRMLLRLWRHRYGLYTPDEVRQAHAEPPPEGSHFRRLARPSSARQPLVLVKEPRAA